MSEDKYNIPQDHHAESEGEFSFPINTNKKNKDIFSTDEKGAFSRFFEYTNENEGSGSDFEEDNLGKNEK